MSSDKTDFKAKLGDHIQLQYIPENNRERLSAEVIGHAPGQSLIISTPKVGNSLPILKEGQCFVIRMLQGSKILGFESSVLKSYALPFPHIYLSQPSKVESIILRGSRRVNTQHSVSIKTADSQQVSARLLNISISGALLLSDTSPGNADDKIVISIDITVAGFDKKININGIIRNVSPTDNADTKKEDSEYGIEFIDMKEEEKIILHGFVYEQIVTQME